MRFRGNYCEKERTNFQMNFYLATKKIFEEVQEQLVEIYDVD